MCASAATVFEMESTTLTLILVIGLNHVHIALTETTVEVSSPLSTVEVGGILTVQCQIWNMETGYTVTIVHTLNERSERISTDKVVLPSTPQASRAFLAVRAFPDGSMVYFLTLLDAVPSDHGEYSCTISSWFGGSFSEIARNTMQIQVVSFPDNKQPICSSNPSKLILQEGAGLELVCVSDKTNPMVDLKWRSLTSYKIIPSFNSTRSKTVSFTLRIRAELDYDSEIFMCEMTSRAFPDLIRTCQIGPITVVSSDETMNDNGNSGPKDHMPDTVNSLQTKAPILTSGCSEKCSSESQTVFYLTVTTATTCLLFIIFFISTMLMCCKYHGISSDTSRRQSFTGPTPVVDPVYVSLQRRRENERVYMTLEDPNNPEGKVLLPKEVFDEFYNRTLSLRKT